MNVTVATASPIPAGKGTVLGVCGYGDSGKTTLLEGVIPVLEAQGIKVAVIKHDVHGIRLDPSAKDSARLFAAGADVLLHGPGEQFFRRRLAGEFGLEEAIADLALDHDLVLVEGHKDTALPKIWLLNDGESAPPPDKTGIVAVLARDADRVERLHAFINGWLAARWREIPLYACVLIGGQSRRMGRPKHLIEKGGRTWLEHIVATLGDMAERVVIAGEGAVPPALAHLPRLPDAPGVQGPLAGILAAMRWAPQAGWMVAACDMPALTPAALQWLISCRRPGVWAVLPRLGEQGVEPLCAYYDYRARRMVETLIAEGGYGMQRLAAHDKVDCPAPPPHLAAAWRNMNTQADLQGVPGENKEE